MRSDARNTLSHLRSRNTLKILGILLRNVQGTIVMERSDRRLISRGMRRIFNESHDFEKS